MQSTGQTSTQALSLTLMHGSAMTYAMVIFPPLLYGSLRCPRSQPGTSRACRRQAGSGPRPPSDALDGPARRQPSIRQRREQYAQDGAVLERAAGVEALHLGKD